MQPDQNAHPERAIRASAPTRICDNGGWTDTWFARHGRVFSIAVEPRVHVELTALPDNGEQPTVVIDARVFGDRYEPTGIKDRSWGKHPLVEATIVAVGIPEGVAIEIVIDSDAPFGASIGTSAATCVALIGALDALTPGRLNPYEVAQTAWRVETEQLGQQSGIQDQLAAAFGGINLVDMHEYPDATVQQLAISTGTRRELQRRLVVVYLGAPHSSSAVHETVIRDMEALGPRSSAIEALRQTAEPSAQALLAGDFDLLGRAMIANTEAQHLLHSELVCADAWRVIDIARQFGVVGYKVNGAGGNGGSITLLTNGDEVARLDLIDAIHNANEVFAVVPVTLAPHGLIVSES